MECHPAVHVVIPDAVTISQLFLSHFLSVLGDFFDLVGWLFDPEMWEWFLYVVICFQEGAAVEEGYLGERFVRPHSSFSPFCVFRL